MDHRRSDPMVRAFVRMRTALHFAIRGLTRLVVGSSLAGAVAARLLSSEAPGVTDVDAEIAARF